MLNAHHCVLFIDRVDLGLRLGWNVVFGWLVVMHAYLYTVLLSTVILALADGHVESSSQSTIKSVYSASYSTVRDGNA